MSTRTQHQITDNTWFVTFTNHDWILLFQITNTYHLLYKWLKLINEKHSIKTLAFVIMPNHAHFLFHLDKENINLNKIIGNGKRFMAYDIIKKLKETDNSEMLCRLASALLRRKERKVSYTKFLSRRLMLNQFICSNSFIRNWIIFIIILLAVNGTCAMNLLTTRIAV